MMPSDHRPASCDTSLVVSGVFVDGGKGRRNVYDKKFRRYTEDNRTGASNAELQMVTIRYEKLWVLTNISLNLINDTR